jgi:hypothetical protein
MRRFISLTLALAACTAQATSFQLVPLVLDNGTTIKGTIDTDGTTGYLTQPIS